MIKYATVGTGWITDSFIRGCELLGDRFSLEAVYSRSLSKGSEFASRFGCDKVYTELLALAEDPSVAAVYIASPNALHFEQSKLFLEHGKHVICEKPITVTPFELKELQTLAESRGLVYMEALMARHMPSWSTVSEAIKRVGKISHVRFDFSQRSSKYDGYLRGEHQNIFDPEMATGALMDLGIYCIYPAVGWFGRPDGIYSYCNKLETDIDGDGGAILRYKDMTVELCWSKTAQSGIGSEILGDCGTLVIPSISKLTDVELIETNGNRTKITENAEKPLLMSYEAADFYRYITDKSTMPELKVVNELALTVNEIMLDIRRRSDINFKGRYQ